MSRWNVTIKWPDGRIDHAVVTDATLRNLCLIACKTAKVKAEKVHS